MTTADGKGARFPTGAHRADDQGVQERDYIKHEPAGLEREKDH
jgi:hypothetical protein